MRVSAGFSFFEKYEIGHHWSYMHCWRTAPTDVSEASVIMLVAASGCGWTKRVALARASLIEEKAVVVSSSMKWSCFSHLPLLVNC